MKIKVEWNELLLEQGKRDPLGLWRIGDRLMSDLLAPFTRVVSQRPARYFSMYCWILNDLERMGFKADQGKEFWARFYVYEGVFLSTIQLHSSHVYSEFGGQFGSENANALVASADLKGIIEYSGLRKDKISNGWEANYKNPMHHFELIEPDLGVAARLKLTALGKKLAAVYEGTICETAYYKSYRGAEKIPQNCLVELAERACPCLLQNPPCREISLERDVLRERMLFCPSRTDDNDSGMLWNSLHLFLHVLKESTRRDIPFTLNVWREFLTTELLSDRKSCLVPDELSHACRCWRIYAADALLVFGLESGLDGFLEMLHLKGGGLGLDEIKSAFTEELFTRLCDDVYKSIDDSLIGGLSSITELDSQQTLAVEQGFKKYIRNSNSGEMKIIAAFCLCYYSCMLYQRYHENPEYAEAVRFYEKRAEWDELDFSFVDTAVDIEHCAGNVYRLFVDFFLLKWIITRQLLIKTDRGKLMAWFNENPETNTYNWEQNYDPSLYRAARFDNLMGFFMNLGVVFRKDHGYFCTPEDLEAIRL